VREILLDSWRKRQKQRGKGGVSSFLQRNSEGARRSLYGRPRRIAGRKKEPEKIHSIGREKGWVKRLELWEYATSPFTPAPPPAKIERETEKITTRERDDK